MECNAIIDFCVCACVCRILKIYGLDGMIYASTFMWCIIKWTLCAFFVSRRWCAWCCSVYLCRCFFSSRCSYARCSLYWYSKSYRMIATHALPVRSTAKERERVVRIYCVAAFILGLWHWCPYTHSRLPQRTLRGFNFRTQNYTWN